ncbi:50S ribosomal protein L30, partial [Dysosmobacter welbionis]
VKAATVPAAQSTTRPVAIPAIRRGCPLRTSAAFWPKPSYRPQSTSPHGNAANVPRTEPEES